jgi:hypothetical protein
MGQSDAQACVRILKSEAYPISIKFLDWQDNKVGDYIEFKIEVKHQEGDPDKS